VVVSTPDELDGIADGSVDGEWNVTEDTLGRSDPDDVSLSSLRGRLIVRSQARVAGPALLNAVIVRVAPPVVASRTIGGGRLVGGGRGTVPGVVSVFVGRGRLILGGVPVAMLSGEGSRGSPGV